MNEVGSEHGMVWGGMRGINGRSGVLLRKWARAAGEDELGGRYCSRNSHEHHRLPTGLEHKTPERMVMLTDHGSRSRKSAVLRSRRTISN